ncbi:C1 family peptidase [Dyadobacter sp. NIV53]|uniref:C1 family peptidase n=1 Tax=Dyadobacter sp. NIV53 TaxID=2861765 RepID=UPI001C87A3C0|nr:C1 family peptidase [Dyadobacter sp. NIV53]
MNWNNLGGIFDVKAGLSAVSWKPDRLDILSVAGSSVWHKAWDSGSWYPSPADWGNLGGKFDFDTDVAAVSWGKDRLDIFGMAGNSVWHKAWDGSQWYPSPDGWNNLGGKFDPGTKLTAVSWGNNRLDIFALAGQSIWHKAWDTNQWYPSPDGWNNLGGKFNPGTSISAVSWDKGRLDIFAMAGNSIWQKTWDTNQWYPSPTDWTNLGGSFDQLTSISAVSWAKNRLDIFALAGNSIWQKTWDTNQWYPSHSDWTNLGGIFDQGTSIATVSWDKNRLDIFALAGNSVWHKAWDTNQWYPSHSDWYNLGGYFDKGTRLSAVSWAKNRLDIFAHAGHSVWHKAWDGSRWWPYEAVSVDLRPTIIDMGLVPKSQGYRGTCSVFASTFLLEYMTCKEKNRSNLDYSEEYLNAVTNTAIGYEEDGDFFSSITKGYGEYGIVDEVSFPYQSSFDPKHKPSQKLMNIGKAARFLKSEIMYASKPNPSGGSPRGLSNNQIESVKKLLESGVPVAMGFHGASALQTSDMNGITAWNDLSDEVTGAYAHSVPVVGYWAATGGTDVGYFIFRNSGGPDWGDHGYGYFSFNYVSKFVYDVVLYDKEPKFSLTDVVAATVKPKLVKLPFITEAEMERTGKLINAKSKVSQPDAVVFDK